MVLMTATTTAQVAGRRLAAGDDLAALLVDGHFKFVDLGVIPDDRLAERGVAAHQRGERLLDLLFHQSAHLQNLRADVLEFGVILLGDVRV